MKDVSSRNAVVLLSGGLDSSTVLAIARAELPDLVLMDVVMPGMNGYQATRQLHRDAATRHIPVIICTTKGQEADRAWGLRQGAVAYLVKPIDETALLATIRSME